MSRGKFIAFEGIDGCGKSTQIKLLYKYMTELGYKTDITREPTDSEIGMLLRKYMRCELSSDQRTIAALFAADRINHITERGGLLDLLCGGTNILCDRYYMSSYAYHSVDMDMDWVVELNRQSAQLLKPDAHIFIDVPPNEAMRRVEGRGEKELYEVVERQCLVRDNYYTAFEKLKQSENVIIIDGKGTSGEVSRRIIQALKDTFEKI